MKIKIQRFLLINVLLFSFPLFINAQGTTQNEATTIAREEKFADAQAVLIMLRSQPEKLAMTLSILNASETAEAGYKEFNRSYLRDGNYHYLVAKQTDQMTTSILVETNNQEFKRSLILAEDIAKYSAEVLNNDIIEDKNKEIEQFYIFAQNNLDKIRGVYVQVEENVDRDKERLLEFRQSEEYFVSLFTELLKEQTLVPKIEEDEQLGTTVHYTISESIGKKIGEISGQLEKNSVTESMTSLLNRGYVGTLVFSLKTGNLALSVATPSGSEVLEVLLGVGESNIAVPEDSQIMTAEEMEKLAGVNLLTMINNRE